jgi:hypothetical protein
VPLVQLGPASPPEELDELLDEELLENELLTPASRLDEELLAYPANDVLQPTYARPPPKLVGSS